MKVRQGPARAALLSTLVSAVITTLAASPASAAVTPPYEPDANAAGSITFFDATGTAITSGSTSALVGYAVGSASLSATGNKAALYGYLPKSGQAPGQFSGELLAGPTTFPVSGAPAAVSGSSDPAVQPVTGDLTFADLAKDFPNTATDAYAELYQIRVKTSDARYLATDIQISGTTWQQVFPAVAGASVTSTSLSAAPSAGGHTLTATVSPSAAAGSVQFKDGGTALGAPVAVSGGKASTTVALAAGSHTLTAAFTPTDAASYGSSASPSTTYVVKAATTTVLNPQAGAAPAGARYRVSGRVTGVTSTGRILLRQAPRGAAARVVAVPTSANGTFSVVVTAASTTTYTATYAGDATHQQSMSGARTTVVSWKASVAGVSAAARRVTVVARVLPAKGGTVVRLYERRGRSLAQVAAARTAGNGTVRLVTGALARGSHTFVVTVPATASNAIGSSAAFSARV